MSNIIKTAQGDVELTDRELKLYLDLVRFSAAYGFNHAAAQGYWNQLVTEHGTMMVDYLKAIATPARECNIHWGTEGHHERRDAVDVQIHAAMQDIMKWAKPLF